GEFQVGAGRPEADGLRNFREAHALHELAVQASRALHLSERDFVGATIDGDVARNFFRLERRTGKVQGDVADDIVKCDGAALGCDLKTTLTVDDLYFPAVGRDYDVGLAWNRRS